MVHAESSPLSRSASFVGVGLLAGGPPASTVSVLVELAFFTRRRAAIRQTAEPRSGMTARRGAVELADRREVDQ